MALAVIHGGYMRSPRHFRLLTLATALVVAIAGLPGTAAPPAHAQRQAEPSVGSTAAGSTAAGSTAAGRAAAEPAGPTPAGPREFFYDAAGQLAGVADPATGAAAYRYDEAGNLVRTERLGTDALAVFAVVPARGPVGSSVEISGTGFDDTAGATEVTVDGVAATVSRATANRLQVQIPERATEGVGRVSAGGKSATGRDRSGSRRASRCPASPRCPPTGATRTI
jgi:YD repeat-containing protein